MNNIQQAKDYLALANNQSTSATSYIMQLTAQRAIDKGELDAAELFMRLANK